MVAMIKTPTSLILQFGTKTIRAGIDSVVGTTALDLIKRGASDEEILEALNPLASIRRHVTGIFEVNDNGTVFVDSHALPRVLGNRLFDLAECGLISQAQALRNFWNNCRQNPDERAQTDLYAFLEHNGIPITPDGCFIAYRSVRRNDDGDLVDSYTGTMLNNPGCEVKKKREECDPDPDKTCSRGLHVAAFEYASGWSEVLLNVKVHPADVVAIPKDYNGQKMRVCRFVVDSINSETASDGKVIKDPIFGVCDDQDDEDWEDDEDNEDDLLDQLFEDDDNGYQHPNGFVQKRDANGRFLPKGR